MTSTNGNGGSGATVRDPELDRARLRAVHAALTDGDIATAGKLAEDALHDGIDHPMVLNLVAGRREEQGRLDEALALLQRALEAAPEAIGLMNAIGLVLYRMDRAAEAVEPYDAALAREPRFAPALANRATAFIGLTKFEAARTCAIPSWTGRGCARCTRRSPPATSPPRARSPRMRWPTGSIIRWC